MSVRARQIFVAAVKTSLVTGHLQPVRDRALQACGSKVWVHVLRFCIQNMYALKPDLCQPAIYENHR